MKYLLLEGHILLKGSTQMSQENQSILVVDDNDDLRDLIIHFLNADGFHLFAASNGEDALAILKSNPIDCVLLDVMMPGKSGLEVLREIRSHSIKALRDIPVVIITAKSSIEDIDLALESGASSYIVKPFRAATLREKVRSILEVPVNS